MRWVQSVVRKGGADDSKRAMVKCLVFYIANIMQFELLVASDETRRMTHLELI
jgi:hypothetical protein